MSSTPMKPKTFWIVTTLVLLASLVLFGLWISTVVKQFRDIETNLEFSPSPRFEPLNIDGYHRLFPTPEQPQ